LEIAYLSSSFTLKVYYNRILKIRVAKLDKCTFGGPDSVSHPLGYVIWEHEVV